MFLRLNWPTEFDPFVKHYKVTFFLPLFVKLNQYDAGQGWKKRNIREYFEIGRYYCKCSWKAEHVLTYTGIFETIKVHLKPVFLPGQHKQPCSHVSVKEVSDNNTSYLQDSTVSLFRLQCPFQRCRCCENEMNAFLHAPITIMR